MVHVLLVGVCRLVLSQILTLFHTKIHHFSYPLLSDLVSYLSQAVNRTVLYQIFFCFLPFLFKITRKLQRENYIYVIVVPFKTISNFRLIWQKYWTSVRLKLLKTNTIPFVGARNSIANTEGIPSPPCITLPFEVCFFTFLSTSTDYCFVMEQARIDIQSYVLLDTTQLWRQNVSFLISSCCNTALEYL